MYCCFCNDARTLPICTGNSANTLLALLKRSCIACDNTDAAYTLTSSACIITKTVDNTYK